MRSKIVAATAALIIGSGVALVAAPLSASAHSADLKATAVCSTDGGTRTVTYSGTTSSVPNSVSATLSVAASTVVPSGSKITIPASTIAANASYTFTETVPGTAKSASAIAHLVWTDKATADKSASITFASNCAVPVKCVTVLWKIPGGDSTGGHQWDKPQTIVDKAYTACGDLSVPVPTTKCGAYQVDSYVDDAGTESLISGGVLTGPGKPYEHLYSGSSYKYLQYSACVTKDADAGASAGSAATCTSAATIDFSLTNATWQDPKDTTDGSRVAVATAGHVFKANGLTTLTVTYTKPAAALNCDASVTVKTTPPTCTAAGSVDFSSGLVNATWQDPKDTTDGSRVAVATAGHKFANGSSTTTVSYTKAATSALDCDATATASTAPPSCSTAGSVDFTGGLVNATWQDPKDTTDGSRVAVAAAGHRFADGSTTKTVSYTKPASQTLDCDATATVTVTDPTCSTASSVAFGTPANATWNDATDLTDGSRDATADSGHYFSNGSTTLTVTYTIKPQLTTDCGGVVPPSTPPTTPPVNTPPVVSPPKVSPPKVSPPTVVSVVTPPKTTTTTVDSPTVTPSKTSTPVTDPSSLASTGLGESTPVALLIALIALVLGAVIVIVTMRRRFTASDE